VILWTAVAVFLALFTLVTVMGFMATRWRPCDLNDIHEWALAGRGFGTFVSWFLIGGDLYTAYTFIAVPALVYGVGSLGFFALPYTTIVYPLVFLFAPRFWLVAKNRGYITYADFARERFDSRTLAFAVAITGILATMPYIALQLVGMQVVIAGLGFTGQGLAGDLPVIVAFAILAAYTYRGGLRAPAMVAFVKDALIYITIIGASIFLVSKLGGFAHIFQTAGAVLAQRPKPGAIILPPQSFSAYATLALGSGLALFMYPHSITGVLSAKNTTVVRRNMALLPAYSVLLGVNALFGYMAITAGIHAQSPNAAVPMLFVKMFPQWFVGMAFAAIAIGALVPAAIMSIAAANLFTRSIYKEYVNPACSGTEETRVARLVSLAVKAGALLFVLFLPTQFAIYFQLLAGAWILQTFPTIVIGLYTHFFHRRALFIGWLAGMATATWMGIASNFTPTFTLHFGGVALPGYIGLFALTFNLIVTALLTIIFDGVRMPRGLDATRPEDYVADSSDASRTGVRKIIVT
jgi:SSS family solute:Na+ symporter